MTHNFINISLKDGNLDTGFNFDKMSYKEAGVMLLALETMKKSLLAYSEELPSVYDISNEKESEEDDN